ncbi:g3200 [Coccomyxa elongata]
MQLYLGDAKSLQRSSLQMKAAGKKVGALVFYGRRRYAKLLNMYLERNLAANGGILDEVVFAVRTDDAEDLNFLETLLMRHPQVYRRSHGPSIRPFDTAAHWQKSYSITRNDHIYVKIDDDIVFIQDGAIEMVVEEKLRGRYLFVSANVVNHPLLSYVHAHLGPLLPFQPPSESLNSSNSHKPFVVTDNATVLDESPARTSRYGAGDACWWADWQCAAIAHYSFLHHLRAGSLGAYDFNTWDLSYPEYQRWSINFFAFNSSDLSGPLITDERDDEVYISQLLPAFRKQHAAAVGRDALVVHFAYYKQEQGLLHNASDLLKEYDRVAELYTNGKLLLKEPEG